MAFTTVAQQQYAQIMSSEVQHHHAEEKEGLMLHSRVSEETDITLLEHIDLDDDNDREKGRDGNTRRRRTVAKLGPLWLWAMHAGVFFTSLIFFVLGATMGPTTSDFVQQFSAYSPALAAVEYENVTFNNTKGAHSEYMGAGPEADNAWEHVTMHMGDQMVSEAGMAELGKPLSHLRVTNPETGESGYRMELAVVHQLHCLNLMRKFVHKDYYKPLGGDLAVSEEHLVGHLNHCIEALRLKLMCEADVGVILYQEQPGPNGKMEPDYETKHTCRNWDKVREWAIENKVADKTTF